MTLNNGKEIKVNIDHGNGLPYKQAIIPALTYGDWTEDSSVTLIKVIFNQKELSLFNNSKIKYKELHFIEGQFWFDLDEFYLIIHSNEYIYNHIYHKKFAIIFYDNNNKEMLTLNFTKSK